MTLSRRDGIGNNDHNALGRDELPVDGIVTSFARLDILSKYSEPNDGDRRIFELEIYAGNGVYGATRNDLFFINGNVCNVDDFTA